MQEKAACWPDYRNTLKRSRERTGNVIITADSVRIEEELGDVLFSMVNLARHLAVDPESALIGTCLKFIRRFNYVEKMAGASGRDISSFSLSELDRWWEEAKKQ